MQWNIGFLGAGGIAKYHIAAIKSLPFYYEDTPIINLCGVSSANINSYQTFAKQHGFEKSLSINEILSAQNIDTLFILSPNEVHFDHLNRSLDNPNIKNIYIEKPLCFNAVQINKIMEKLATRSDVKIQVGFQFLQNAAIIRARKYYSLIGTPINFRAVYLHSGYLKKSYREKRSNRLLPSPLGGALSDLGSHVFSLILSFLGNNLKVVYGDHSGSFEDVSKDSDLFSLIYLKDLKTGAIGTISASRISVGTTDLLEMEIYGTKGSLIFSTKTPDILKICLDYESGNWENLFCGNDYSPYSVFPSNKVSGGWLRSLIHSHYLFFQEKKVMEAIIPDINHGIEVEKLIHQSNKFLHNDNAVASKNELASPA